MTLRRIPPEYLSWVELSRRPMREHGGSVDETVNHRRLPGEGEFDIPGYVAGLPEGRLRGPWGVEVLSEELRSLPIEQDVRASI